METVNPSEYIKDYATKLVVSLVKSPLYNENNIDLDRELKSHFYTKNHKLKLGEHFNIKSRLNSNLTCQFKVVDVEPKSLSEFFVDTLHTSLILTEQPVTDEWIWPKEYSAFFLIFK